MSRRQAGSDRETRKCLGGHAMRGRILYFGAGCLLGAGMSMLAGPFGSRALGFPLEGEGETGTALAGLLDRMRATPMPAKGPQVFPPEVLSRARALWPEIGAVLSGKGSMSDQRLLLHLVRQAGPEARGVLKDVCRSMNSSLDDEGVEEAVKSICSDRDIAVREMAALARDKSSEEAGMYPMLLGRIAVPAEQLFPVELDLMKEADPDVRVSAADAIHWQVERFNRLFPPMRPAMMRAFLEDPDERVRSAAKEVLTDGGMGGGQSLDILIQGLKSRHVDEEQVEVLFLLSTFSVQDLEAVVLRVDPMLTSEDPLLRRWGIRLAMKGLPRTRHGLLPKLRKATQDSDSAVKQEAQAALDAFEGKE